MGYLSQKKKQTNIKEILNLSLIGLSFCCFFILFFKESLISQKISPWLFHVYVYALIMMVYALITKFYWQASGLMFCSILLFFNIAMGGNLFLDDKTKGVQDLSILYQTSVHNASDSIKQMKNENVDIAAILGPSSSEFKAINISAIDNESEVAENLIVSKYKFLRSGEVLLSKNGRAAFADIKVNLIKMIFIALDFSKLKKQEKKVALHNLTEFINMQDVPVIVIGDFGLEAWSTTFLDFLEHTKLEVKNSVILSNGNFFFNPFKVPSLNILAYKDFGIKERSFLSAKRNPNHPLMIQINY